jgi:quercetin dioxygenase-like cupin family protein
MTTTDSGTLSETKVRVVSPGDWNLTPHGQYLTQIITDGTDFGFYVHVGDGPPRQHVGRHSHPVPEINIVLSGSVIIGGREYGAGTMMLIPADEEYDFDIGGSPTTFLVVRPPKAESLLGKAAGQETFSAKE